jgi:cysteine desulfurase
MGEAIIELNGNEATLPCASALERQTDPSLIPHRLQRLFDLVGARPDDRFVFTSSGAEAVNQVLWSVFLEVSRKVGKCHFITSALEDAPTMQMLKRLEDLGCFVKIAPLNSQGQIDLEQLALLINPRTALISVAMAQGLSGVIQPVEEIGALAKAKGVLLHLDAAQATGKYYFSFAELDADYLTFSGDLIHSVAGSGGLFAKKEAPLVPLILGGKGLRGGSFDIPSFLSLCAAAQQCSLFLDNMSLEVARLRDLFEREVARLIPGAKPLFRDALRLPHTTVIAFPRVHQEALQYLLEKKVKGSIGGQYSQHLSSLLASSGVENPECAVSFALSRMTTEEDVTRAAQEIARAVTTLQFISHGVFDGV